MKLSSEVTQNEGVLVVRIPLKRRSRGGKRLMVVSDAPANASSAHSPTSSARDALRDDPILKGLGRAWRWKRSLESEEYATIADLAAAEKVHKAYLCRLLRMTLLSPAITRSILDGTLSRDVLLADLINLTTVHWVEQERRVALRET